MFRIVIIVSFIFCAACSSSDISLVEESEERQFKSAKDFQSQGRHGDALISYLSLISIRRDSPESHLEAGYIYLQKLKDPIRAIFHFDRFIELEPDSERIIQVKQLIETAKLEFLRQLPIKPYQAEVDRLDLLNIIDKLTKENNELKLKYNQVLYETVGNGNRESFNSPLAPSTVTNDLNNLIQEGLTDANTRQSSSELDFLGTMQPEEIPKIYEVKAGDTLSKISKKFFGTAIRWTDIFEANRDVLSNAGSLRVGQKLTIP